MTDAPAISSRRIFFLLALLNSGMWRFMHENEALFSENKHQMFCIYRKSS